ncbi:hypothetical protein Trydic_g2211 [Trypoxylus dichotomus]
MEANALMVDVKPLYSKTARHSRLIEMVKQEPCLYNHYILEYKDRDKKNAIWNRIAQELTYKTGTIVRFKWKSLRDSYVKYLKETKAGPGKKRRYLSFLYRERMAFLDPFIEFKRRPKSAKKESETEKSDVPNEDTLIEKEEYTISESNAEAKEPSAFMETDLSSEDNPSKSNSFHQQSVHYSTERRGENDVDIFFSGLAKIVKKLPKVTQAKLKLECSTLVLNAEIEYEQSRQASSSSPSPQFVSVLRVSPTTVGLPNITDDDA